MRDVVVTCPKDLWLPWLEEGDLPGEKWSGKYWSFYVSGAMPELDFTGKEHPADAYLPAGSSDPESNSPGDEMVWQRREPDEDVWCLVSPGQRCYVVAHGRLRGYADLFAVETYASGRLKAFIRRGGAEPLTIAEPILGFRGWRYRTWERSVEVPFPDWKTAGVTQ